MLVVVVIIGIVITGAILSLGGTGRDRQLEAERDRLTALIDYVRDRGALMATEYGIRCGVHGYRFVYFDNRTNQWMPETLDDTLRLRKLPAGLDLQLVVEGRTIVLDDDALKFSDPGNGQNAPALADVLSGSSSGSSAGGSSPGSAGTPSNDPLAPPSDLNGEVANNAPQIMLLSNGDTNSFTLTIAREDSQRTVTLKSNADGTIAAGDIVDARQ
jgi:general secretion pathway protein H